MTRAYDISELIDFSQNRDGSLSVVPKQCQHEMAAPCPTLRPACPEGGMMLYICNVCQGHFKFPIAVAQSNTLDGGASR